MLGWSRRDKREGMKRIEIETLYVEAHNSASEMI